MATVHTVHDIVLTDFSLSQQIPAGETPHPHQLMVHVEVIGIKKELTLYCRELVLLV